MNVLLFVKKQFDAAGELIFEVEDDLSIFEKVIQIASNIVFAILWLALFYIIISLIGDLFISKNYSVLEILGPIRKSIWFWVIISGIYFFSLRILIEIKKVLNPLKIMSIVGIISGCKSAYNLIFNYTDTDFENQLEGFFRDLF